MGPKGQNSLPPRGQPISCAKCCRNLLSTALLGSPTLRRPVWAGLSFVNAHTGSWAEMIGALAGLAVSTACHTNQPRLDKQPRSARAGADIWPAHKSGTRHCTWLRPCTACSSMPNSGTDNATCGTGYLVKHPSVLIETNDRSPICASLSSHVGFLVPRGLADRDISMPYAMYRWVSLSLSISA